MDLDRFDAGAAAVVPCQKVLGAGDMCGMPSEPGFVHCAKHVHQLKKKVLRERVLLVQEQVFDLVEGQVEAAVMTLVGLMHDEASRSEVKLKAATTLLQLAGADLAAPTAHRESVAARERKALEGLISSQDEDLLLIVSKVAPERAAMLRERAIAAASRELGEHTDS